MEKRLENEVEHGKFLAQNGAGEIWNWESPAGKLRWKRRVNMLTSHIELNMNVLEIGCGSGYFTQELAKTGAHITAIDISPDLIQLAKKNITSKNVDFILENAYALSFESNRFDSIVGSSVLHHLDVGKALSEFYRVLKKGGSIYFTEPNMLNPQIAIQKNIPFIKKAMGDSPDETAFFKWGLGKKIRHHGFKDISVEPFDFLHPSIPVSMIPFFQPICDKMEKIPFFNQIAGSLFLRAVK
jgi:SAM-dependent methyltransferase